MKRKITPMVTLAILLVMLTASVSAQTTGPDSDVEITCSETTYTADIFGNVDIYCDITNNGVPAKAMKVGAVFDDYLGTDVEIVEVNVDGSPVNRGLTKLPPQADKVKTRVLSNQVVNILSGQSKQLHLKIKVPVPSTGKFDVLFGDPELGGEYRLDPWWDTSWDYKACWNLSGHTKNLTGDLANLTYGYPFNLTINSQSLIGASKMQSDCDDIRLIYNETTDVNFFTRDCGATVTEVWGAWNFTVGETYEMCLYYGNTTVGNNESDPYDIVYIWEDFENASAFNSTGDWESRFVCQYGDKSRGPANISGGKMVYQDNVTTCGGNDGEWFWRNDVTFNLSEVGFLTDQIYWYNVPDDGQGQRYPSLVRGLVYTYDTANYGVSSGNHSAFMLRDLQTWDRALISYNDTAWDLHFFLRNTSNLYSSMGHTDRFLYSYNPETYNFTLRNNYSGQPYTDPIIFDTVIRLQSPTQMVSQAWVDAITGGTGTVTLEYGSAKGQTRTTDWARYDYWFARPWIAGEPLATGGAEIPLNSADLIVNYTSPTPANASLVIANPVIVNVTSNKTVYRCVIDLNGTNFTMTTDTDYCYHSFNASDGDYSYNVFVEDLWGWQNETVQREFTYSGPPQIAIYSPVTQFYTDQNVYVNVSADKAVSTWLYNLNGSANSTLTPNTTITFPDGYYLLEVWANDSLDVWGSSTREFGVDTFVNYTIISPVGTQTYSVSSIPLTISENEANLTINYTLDSGINISFTGNTSISVTTEKLYTLDVYVWDTHSNFDHTSLEFTYYVPVIEKEPITALIPIVMIGMILVGLAGAFLTGAVSINNMVKWLVIAMLGIVIAGLIYIL